jgi:hypothetical protein
MTDDVVVGGEHAVRQPVVADELPDVFNRVQLGRSGWQRQEGDVGGHDELGRDVPSGLIEHENCMSARIDGRADLLEVLGHSLGFAPRHDEAGALALGRADRPEDVGPFGSLIVRRSRARSAPCPASRDGVLLADPSFVLPPQLYGGAGRELGFDRRQFGRESFLKAAMAGSLCA